MLSLFYGKNKPHNHLFRIIKKREARQFKKQVLNWGRCGGKVAPKARCAFGPEGENIMVINASTHPA
jgi:hypothetical protein